MKRIRYISRFARPHDAASLAELTRQAKENNEQLGITGVLVATGSVFFQLIEGPDEAVDELFRKIVDDPRHVDVLPLGVEEGDLKRVYPDWAMKGMDLSDDSNVRLMPVRVLLETVFRQRELMDDVTRALEATMWHVLIEAEQIAIEQEFEHPPVVEGSR